MQSGTKYRNLLYSLLWHNVNNCLGVKLNYCQFLGLYENFRPNAIITIVIFLIYKQWLLLFLDDESITFSKCIALVHI